MVRVAECALLACAVACGSSDKPPDGPPEPTEELVVTVQRPLELTEQARIPQNDPNFDHAEVTADSVVLVYTSAPKETLEVGHVIVGTGGADTFLRRITAVTESTETRVAVTTEPAYITDFIVDGAFTVDFNPGADNWEVSVPHEIGGRTLEIQTELSIFSIGSDGFTCTPVGGVESIAITPVLAPDLSHRVQIDVTSKIYPILGELASAEFSMRGQVTVGLDVDMSLTGGLQCALDLIEYLRDGNPHALKIQRHVTFAIGPVPVEITIFLEPVFKVEGTVSAAIASLMLSGRAVMSMEAGVQYGDPPGGGEKIWTPIWNTSVTGTAAVDISNDVGELSVSSKAQAGFTIGALLYDIVGPTVSLTGYLEDKLVVNVPECSYLVTAGFGAEVAIGVKLQIPIIAKEIAKVSEAFNLAEVEIAEIPGTLPFCGSDAGPPGDAGVVTCDTGSPTDITSDGTVFAETVFAPYVAALSVDGDLTTSWFSTGPDADSTPTIYRWTAPSDECIDNVRFRNNSMHSMTEWRTDFGFGSVDIVVLDASDAVVFTQTIALPGTPDAEPDIAVGVVGRKVELHFSGHENPVCGGISELNITGRR